MNFLVKKIVRLKIRYIKNHLKIWLHKHSFLITKIIFSSYAIISIPGYTETPVNTGLIYRQAVEFYADRGDDSDTTDDSADTEDDESEGEH